MRCGSQAALQTGHSLDQSSLLSSVNLNYFGGPRIFVGVQFTSQVKFLIFRDIFSKFRCFIESSVFRLSSVLS